MSDPSKKASSSSAQTKRMRACADDGGMYDAVATAVERAGLKVRGGFHPGPEDGVPRLRTGAEAGTLILVGNVGSSLWEPFAAAGFIGRTEHPLDDWSREVVSKLGRDLGADPLFPFGGPPFLPFIRWALRADTVWPSVMGPLIHPRYGLWHAYRGALSFAERFKLPPREDRAARRPCDECRERPCLSPCPVGAVREGAFDAAGCARWLTERPRCDCREAGCLARSACPVGREHAYRPAHAAFHMAAFAKANATRRDGWRGEASPGSGGAPGPDPLPRSHSIAASSCLWGPDGL